MMKQTIPHAVMIAVTLALVAAPSRASWTTIAPGLDLGDFPIARPAGDRHHHHPAHRPGNLVPGVPHPRRHRQGRRC